MIMIMLMVATAVLVGFTELILAIIPCDVAIILAVLTFEKRTRTLMRKKESKQLSNVESPIDWLKGCTVFSALSLLASLAYVIFNVLNIEIVFPFVANNSLLIYTIGFFIFAIIGLVRTAVFILEPSSRANVFAGKLIYLALKIFIKISLLSFIAVFQFLNATLFSSTVQSIVLQELIPSVIRIVYATTIILSFVGAIPIMYSIIVKQDEKTSRWDWITSILFLLPWVVLFIIGVLMRVGINLL